MRPELPDHPEELPPDDREVALTEVEGFFARIALALLLLCLIAGSLLISLGIGGACNDANDCVRTCSDCSSVRWAVALNVGLDLGLVLWLLGDRVTDRPPALWRPVATAGASLLVLTLAIVVAELWR